MSSGAGTTGFYGKTPVAGDFVRRGLPRETVQRWDRWMEQALPEAIAVGGGGGHWRFIANPGVFGQAAIAGVFSLSRDRVGRRFPMLIACAGTLPEPTDPWFSAADGVLGRALEGALGIEALGAVCAGLDRPGSHGSLTGAARFWLEPGTESDLTFASLGDLAGGGLERLFAIDGPPAWVEGGEDPFDAEESARLAEEAGYSAQAPDSEISAHGDIGELDFDDLLSPPEADGADQHGAPSSDDPDDTLPDRTAPSVPDDRGQPSASADEAVAPFEDERATVEAAEEIHPLDDLLPELSEHEQADADADVEATVSTAEAASDLSPYAADAVADLDDLIPPDAGISGLADTEPLTGALAELDQTPEPGTDPAEGRARIGAEAAPALAADLDPLDIPLAPDPTAGDPADESTTDHAAESDAPRQSKVLGEDLLDLDDLFDLGPDRPQGRGGDG